MSETNDINLQILEEVGGSSDFLTFQKIKGRQHFLIDSTQDQVFGITKKLWLNWNKTFYISLDAVGIAERKIKTIAQRIRDRKSDLYKCLRIDSSLVILAKCIETEEEGYLNVSSKMYLDILKDSYKDGSLRNHCLEVTTSVTGSGSKKKITRVPMMIETNEVYKSKLELPHQYEPSEEMVDYYIDTVYKLAKGENLDPDKVREEYNSICEKHFEQLDVVDSIEDIFDLTSSGEKVNLLTGEVTEEEEEEDVVLEFGQEDKTLSHDELLEEFDALAEKANLKITSVIKKKLKTINGTQKIISQLKQQVGA